VSANHFAGFWAKVDKTEGCWNWTASKLWNGYGQWNLPRALTSGVRLRRAHRLAYELEVGPIPDGMVLDHLCNNRACVNPSHLEVVTQAENLRRAGERRTHCRNGHKRPEAAAAGRRRCTECDRATELRRAPRRRGVAA